MLTQHITPQCYLSASDLHNLNATGTIPTLSISDEAPSRPRKRILYNVVSDPLIMAKKRKPDCDTGNIDYKIICDYCNIDISTDPKHLMKSCFTVTAKAQELRKNYPKSSVKQLRIKALAEMATEIGKTGYSILLTTSEPPASQQPINKEADTVVIGALRSMDKG